MNKSQTVTLEILKQYLNFINWKIEKNPESYRSEKKYFIINHLNELTEFSVNEEQLIVQSKFYSIEFFYNDCSIEQISGNCISLTMKKENDPGIFINMSNH